MHTNLRMCEKFRRKQNLFVLYRFCFIMKEIIGWKYFRRLVGPLVDKTDETCRTEINIFAHQRKQRKSHCSYGLGQPPLSPNLYNGEKTLRISIQTCVLQTQALTTLVATTCLVSCATQKSYSMLRAEFCITVFRFYCTIAIYQMYQVVFLTHHRPIIVCT